MSNYSWHERAGHEDNQDNHISINLCVYMCTCAYLQHGLDEVHPPKASRKQHHKHRVHVSALPQLGGDSALAIVSEAPVLVSWHGDSLDELVRYAIERNGPEELEVRLDHYDGDTHDNQVDKEL